MDDSHTKNDLALLANKSHLIKDVVRCCTSTCRKSCHLFGCLDSPSTSPVVSSAQGTNKITHYPSPEQVEKEEVLLAHNPNGKFKLVFIDLDKIISSQVTVSERLRLGRMEIDGSNLYMI